MGINTAERLTKEHIAHIHETTMKHAKLEASNSAEIQQKEKANNLTVAVCNFFGTEALAAYLSPNTSEAFLELQEEIPNLFKTIGTTESPSIDALRGLAFIGIYNYLDVLEHQKQGHNEKAITFYKILERTKKNPNPDLPETLKDLILTLPIEFTKNPDYYYKKPNMSSLTSHKHNAEFEELQEEGNCISACAAVASAALQIGIDRQQIRVINTGAHVGILIRTGENKMLLYEPSYIKGTNKFRELRHDPEKIKNTLQKYGNLGLDETSFRDLLSLSDCAPEEFFNENTNTTYKCGKQFYEEIGAQSECGAIALQYALSLNTLEEGMLAAIFLNMGAVETFNYSRNIGGNRARALEYLQTTLQMDPDNTSAKKKLNFLDDIN